MRYILTLLFCLSIVTGYAQNQTPFVPEDRLERSRRLQDDRIVFCVVAGEPTSDFDRDVAEALAESLLLEAEFHEIPPDFPVYEAQDFLYALYLLLMNSCNAFVGMNLAPEAYPSWLTFTRAYASIPFVLAVTDETYSTLGDVPPERPLGVAMMSRADMGLIRYLQTLSENDRWRRFPYADPELMLTRLLDGTIAGAFFWAPDLANLLRENPEAERVRTVPTDPLPDAEAGLGVAMLAQDTYLRTTLDQAIVAVIEDGTMQELLETHDLTGRAGDLGR